MNVSAQITTIIPTYRRPQKLDRAIRSVLAQSYRNFEVHVFDNASGDATRDIVNGIAAKDSRVKYFCQPKNVGFVRNFSSGMLSARTTFVNLLGDDDLLLPNFFADAMNSFSRHPEAFLFAGLVSERHGSDRAPWGPVRNLIKPGIYSPPSGFTALMRESVPRLWTGMLFRREVFEQVGTLDETLITQHDHEFVIRVALRWPVVFENSPCAVFFHNTDLIHISELQRRILHGWFQILDKVEHDPGLPSSVRRGAVQCLKRRLRWDLIRSGLLSGINGRSPEAAEAATLLEQEVNSKWSGRALSLLARRGVLGNCMRSIASSAVLANRKWRGIKDHVMRSEP